MTARYLTIAVLLVAAGNPARGADPDPPAPQEQPKAAASAVDASEPGKAQATGGHERRIVEEIIVTAQKTEESVQEVPISMSVMDSEFIAEQSITDYRDLGLYTPNTHIDPGNGLFPDINIRGFGSALSNKAFEQAVGLVIDGVPYGRAPYFQGPLFDVDRVEVLRGPQGTLFGKNTTAGLLNVVTKKPSGEYTGSIDLDYGQLDRIRVEAAAGGPVVRDWVEFRLSGLYDQRDGLVENTTAAVVASANERMNDRDRKGFRAQLGLPSRAGFDLVLGYERIDYDITGIGWELDQIPERTRPFYRLFDPGVDFDPFNHRGSVDTAERNNNDMSTLVVNAGYELGAGWALRGVGGHSLVTVRSLIDDDFGPAPMTVNTSSDDNPQTTAELRIESPELPGLFGLGQLLGLPLGHHDFIAGVFFQDRKIEDSELSIYLNVPVLGLFAAFNNQPAGSPVPVLADFIGPAVPIAGLGVFDTRAGVGRTTMLFGQETKAFAGFTHHNWRFLERWELQTGIRFANETKEASWNRSYSTGLGQAAFTALGGETFVTSRDRSEFHVTPKVSLRYDWTDDLRFYASWGKGFKAGGFNEQVYNPTDEALEYATEKATAYELGTKLRLLDGSATVNLALFRQEVTDFQVLTLPPNSVSTTVVNAGKARAQGVEMDSVWLPTDWLALIGTVGFNDSEFLEFPLGQCSFDRPDTDGNGDGRCDVSGEPLFRTPKWATTLVANARFPLTSFGVPKSLGFLGLEGVDLVGGGSFEYQDVQYLERTFDERVRQSPFFRFGANMGFANLGQGWSARVVVENLTDRKTGILIRDVPLGGGNFAKLPEPQRQVFGTVRWSF